MTMTHNGTITTTRQDESLVMTGELTDGRKVYVLRDADPQSPDNWENVVQLTLVGYGASQYTLGTSDTYVTEAYDRFRNGIPSRLGTVDTDDAVARYMRIFHNSAVLPVSLHGSCQSDWADGYVVLDLADAEDVGGRANVQSALKSIADEWQTYFSGDVYGFIVVNEETGEEDSCWGF